MSTLYRKYRPQSFKDLIGQNHIKITLEHELERAEIGHAYLFCGPRGLGKTTTARLLAKAVNCEKRKAGESEPCNKCDSCRDITDSRSFDVVEIDAASHTGVDKVRENIIENIRFTPSRSKYKVFIIDEVHMLSTSAFNALLKTLEEPPSYVIFILCTTEIHKLPQTIISRCQRFDFKKVDTVNLLKRLEYLVKQEKKKVAPEVLKNIVIHAEGCIRDAESLLGKILTLGEEISLEQAEIILPHSDFKKIVSFLEFLSEKNATAAIELINKLVEEGMDLQIFVDQLVEFMRHLLLIKTSQRLDDFGIELDEELARAAQQLSVKFNYEEILTMIDLFLSKKNIIKSSVIQQLPLELAVVQICEDLARNNSHDDQPPPTTGKGGLKDRLYNLSEKRKNKDQNETNLSEVRIDRLENELKVNLLAPSEKLPAKVKIDFKRLKESWPLIIDQLLKTNYTLAALLRLSQPLKARENLLEVGVKNGFYQDRLNDPKNKKIVEEAIAEVIKVEISVLPVLMAQTAAEEKSEKSVEPDKPDFVVSSGTKRDPVQEVINMF